MSETTNQPAELDVRVIPPREKHPTIFQTFLALRPGEAFILVNDHDPMPLRYQFEFQYPDRSEEHTSELQSRGHLVCRLLLEKKKQTLNICKRTPGDSEL